MASTTDPVQSAAGHPPDTVVLISHSPLFYWWPVWAVGFVAAALSYLNGYQVALVPPGTVAQQAAHVEGLEGARDVLVVPAGGSLPSAYGNEDPTQPRLRMVAGNDLGIVWALTLCVVIVLSMIPLRGLWSLVVIVVVVLGSILLAVLGLWNPILRAVRVADVHLTAYSYLIISLVLFLIWLVSFLFFDRLKYMVFTRGQVRVRLALSQAETVYDTRGMVVQRHRDDLFRHWLLGFGSGDITVRPAGSNVQIELPNVLGIGGKIRLVHTMLQEREVVRGTR